MADETDIADELTLLETELSVKSVAYAASKIPLGRAGECFYCGEEFPRVVEVTDPSCGELVEACGFCRDKRGL